MIFKTFIHLIILNLQSLSLFSGLPPTPPATLEAGIRRRLLVACADSHGRLFPCDICELWLWAHLQQSCSSPKPPPTPRRAPRHTGFWKCSYSGALDLLLLWFQGLSMYQFYMEKTVLYLPHHLSGIHFDLRTRWGFTFLLRASEMDASLYFLCSDGWFFF